MSEQKQQGCGNFPLACSPLSTLIGREQEVEEGWLLSQRPAIRLLTLTGMGGVGKTRLVISPATVKMIFPYPESVLQTRTPAYIKLCPKKRSEPGY